MRFVPALAVVTTGLALYLSRGVLDQVLIGNAPVRVALLPPWQTLGGFAALAALGLLWLDRRAVPRGTSTAVRPRLGPLVLPAIGLVTLLVPYLPFVSDAIPALQMLAGPGRAVIWLAILGQLVWVWWQTRIVRADWLQRLTLRRLAIIIGVATALVSGVVASRLTGTVLYPGGDEPHYLIIAQSLWRDGDLKIENNHTQRDYAEYFAPDLAPHFLTRGADSEIYSIHPVGLAVLMAPVYAAGGYRLVVIGVIAMAALAAAMMWLSVVRWTNAAGAATFAWAAIALTAPFLFNSFAVYPEIAGALAVVVAFTRAVDLSPRSPIARWLPVGLACAALPWLSTKYAPMSAALVAIAIARVLWPTSDGLQRTLSRFKRKPPIATSEDVAPAPGTGTAPKAPAPAPGTGTQHLAPAPGIGTAPKAPALALVLVPYAISLAAWIAFFDWIWGTPWPQAPYGKLVQTELSNLWFGAPGLLFDQEYGLLPYAPVYILAFTGLWRMWREGGELGRRAIEATLTLLALVVTVGAFRIWWGGSAAPGRPLTSGLLLLMLPMAVALSAAPAASARRAAHHLLLATSVGLAGILCLAQDGFLTANGRDGTSTLLEYLSPRWPAWTAAPSFILHEYTTALLHTAVWLALSAAAALLLMRLRPRYPGTASLAAMATCAGALLAGALLVPLVPATPAWPAIDIRARGRSPILDEFDSISRPFGIEYSPLRLTSASSVAARAVLETEPGVRADVQPVRVLHNGRFSLPPGRYRAEIEWSGARNAEILGLQIGRTGEPWKVWPVEPRPGERWSAEFTLPLDAEFVGFRGTPELERLVHRIAIVPLSLVDRARRPKLPPVTGASSNGTVSYFFYDDNALAEAAGFWVRGGRATLVTVVRGQAEGPFRLRVNSGLIDNRLHVSTLGWSTIKSLQARSPDVLEIPTSDRDMLTLELSADDMFVPRQMDPTSSDPRPLGVWIEVIQP